MIAAGMDTARLNFSHGSPPELLPKIETLGSLNAEHSRHINILGDLQGHRIRIGKLLDNILLKKNQMLKICQSKITGNDDMIPFDYKGPLSSIEKGQKIFIDDGHIALEVKGKTESSLQTKVISGGILKENKGVNMPGAKLDFGQISEKDKKDIAFCKKHNFEFIAQSFVRNKKDIMEVKDLLGPESNCRIIAKIENREGIKNIDEIINVSDGIMIARGDMGVSLPIYEIPIIQKMIIKKCNLAGKFVITATEMLDSMGENPRPTRAEVTDVANAIIDGTDFLMLSAETAIGKYPVETVKMMRDIINFTEKNYNRENNL